MVLIHDPGQIDQVQRGHDLLQLPSLQMPRRLGDTARGAAQGPQDLLGGIVGGKVVVGHDGLDPVQFRQCLGLGTEVVVQGATAGFAVHFSGSRCAHEASSLREGE